MTYWDNVVFTKDSVDPLPDMTKNMLGWIRQQMTIPTKEDFLSDDWFAVGKNKRTALAATCPGMPETQAFF